MMIRLHHRVHSTLLMLIGLAAIGVLALALFLLRNPLASMLLIGAALTLPLYLLAIERPMLCLYSALFLLLLPPDLRFEPFYMLATNGALVTALAIWMAKPGPSGHWSGTLILFALLIGWAAMTVLWADDPVASRRELVAWLTQFTLLFLIVNQIRSVRQVDSLMYALRIIGWLIVAASIYTIFFTNYDFTRRLRVFGMNENSLGLTLILMLPGVIWPVLRSAGDRRKLLMAFSIVYILCTLILVALSGSRGTAISFVCILFTFMFARATRPWGLVGFTLVAGVMLVAPFLFGVVLQRFSEEEGGELGGRADLWEASLRFIAEHPFTGAGVGNGPTDLHDYIASVSNAHNHRMDLPSHQPFLEIGVDMGLVGIALYLAAILVTFVSFARSHAVWAAIPGAPAGYHMIVAGTTASYLTSWFKGGGVKNHPTFFLVLALLLLPAHLATVQGITRRNAGSRKARRPDIAGNG